MLERGRQADHIYISTVMSRTTWVDLDYSKLIHQKTKNELGRKEKGQKDRTRERKKKFHVEVLYVLPTESENSIPCKSSFWG